MENRKGFNFYRSYYDVAKELPKEDRLDFLMAILEMQFTGEEPELSGMAKFAFISQKHSIIRQIEGYKSGINGGRPPKGTPNPPLKGTPNQVQVQVQEQEQEQVQVQEKDEVKDEASFSKFSPEIRNLSKLLFSLMLKNNDNAKQPNFNSWDGHIDKLHRIDGYKINQIREVINWCQNDDFWKSNILSTEKLRKQFARLAIQCKSHKDKTPKSIYSNKQTPIIK